MSMEAAAQGLGIALGRKPLVDGELAQGRLVEAGPVVRADTSYWLVGAGRVYERPESKLFRRWLLSELGNAAPCAPRLCGWAACPASRIQSPPRRSRSSRCAVPRSDATGAGSAPSCRCFAHRT